MAPTIPGVTSTRRTGLAATVLIVVGVLLMVVPPLARDGVCGLIGCADQVPDIAVTRASADRLVVLVPEPATASVRAVRLLEGGSSGARRWAIRRQAGGPPEVPDAFVVGAETPGFRTTTPLEEPPGEGEWVAEVTFRCTTASLPFVPSRLSVGQVVSWAGATSGASFTDSARVEERCPVAAGAPERWLLGLGALMTVVGAVLGIVWVLRRPPRGPRGVDDDPWAADAP